jgi:hypothetical protein
MIWKNGTPRLVLATIAILNLLCGQLVGQSSLLAEKLKTLGEDGNTKRVYASTTQEEYNYIKSGLRFQLENGLGIKPGYKIVREGQWGLTYDSGSWKRMVEFFVVYQIENNTPCGMLMISTRSDTDHEHWFCIPSYGASDALWKTAYSDYLDFTENWESEPARADSWGVIRMLSRSFSDITDGNGATADLNPSQQSFRLNHAEAAAENSVKTVIVANTKSIDCQGNQNEPDAFQNLMSSLLVSEYRVLERAQLEVIFEEFKFGMTGLIAEEDLLEAGRLAGAQGAVICTETCLDGHTELKTVKLIDCRSGESLWSATGIGLNSSEFAAKFMEEF